MTKTWPARSLAEVDAMLTAPGQMFETVEVDIGGRPVLAWKNLPATLAGLLAMARQQFGSREFLVLEDDRVTYDAFHRAVAAFAAELAALGVGPGDRVAIAMRNLPEFPIAFFAATALGAIAVPLNAWWRDAELAYGVADSGATVLVCDPERQRLLAPRRGELTTLRHLIVCRAPDADGVLALEAMIGRPNEWDSLPDRRLPAVDVRADDPGALFYTSGTTGEPKGAVTSHRNMLSAILSGAYSAARAILRRGELPPAPEDQPQRVVLQTIPLFHTTGWNSFCLGAMGQGAKLVLMRRWDTVEAMRIIERERVTLTGGVPTIAWQLIEHPERHRFDLSSLEAISYGGAPAAPDLVQRIESDLRTFPGSGWGMTETSATLTHHTGEEYLARPDSCGPPVPVARLKVMDMAGTRELPTGEVGELWAYGPMVVSGYWNKPAANAATFVDGWVRTGDLARLDDEGFCYIVDRAKDIVIRGGENIYSSEVENALYEHPAVTDAAVVGIPHRTLGEEPAAVVHLAPDATAGEDELRDWVRARLAAFKVPVRILFSDTTLPRNANGKIVKTELKALFATA